MAKLIMTLEESSLCEAVGATAFLQGREHLRRGDVGSVQGSVLDGRVRGRVGAGSRPHRANAIVERRFDGTLRSVSSTCTCATGSLCSHAVALLLATMPAPSSAEGLDPDPAWQSTAWEQSFGSIVRADPVRAAAPASLALQFEVEGELSGSSQVGRAGRSPCRIGLRPVVRSTSGNWVRQGISWSGLSYMGYSRSRVPAPHLRLLTEILALASDGNYGFYNPAIYLDSISRRIWDLLAEAQEVGLPLVPYGRHAAPVTVHSESARLQLDVARQPGGLIVQPQITIDGTAVGSQARHLVGDPAHGIAWWPHAGPEISPQDRPLHLAALAGRLDAGLAELLTGGTVRVPERDEARFLRDYYPDLRQRVDVISSDASVELPESRPPTLSLTVTQRGEHQVAVTWSWLYAIGEARRPQPLWPEPNGVVPPRRFDRDAAVERRILQSVTGAVSVLPELFEQATAGQRLAATTSLHGVATARLLGEVLPVLNDLPEVDVQLVLDGAVPDYRETDAAPVISFAGATSANAGDWFDLAVTVTVEGQDVPFERLFVALAQDQPHLILPSGTYFRLDREEFRQLAELIAEARAMHDAPAGTVRLNRFQAGLWAELEQLGVIDGQAAAWQEAVRALQHPAEPVDHPLPQGMHATLRPYQETGFGWLVALYENRLGGVLADDMGLGKTLQTLALICHVREQGLTRAPFLVVAPTSVVSNWAAEAARFAPGLRVASISQTKARRGDSIDGIAAEADLVITSYTLFRLEYDDYQSVQWGGLVLDEAQFVKNHQARAYQCAKQLPVGFKLAITGTPMENNLMELWSLLSITAPGLFAVPARFSEYYRAPIEKEHDVDRLAQLRRRIRPLMLRRSKEQVLADLPDKQEQIIDLELNARHRKIYQTYLQRERQKVLGLLGDMTKNRFEIFRSLTLLRQASLDIGLVDPGHAAIPSTKLDAMMERMDDVVREGHRVLVFSQFTRFLSSARRRLDAAGIEYCYLDGSTRDRAAVLKEFRTGTAPVFLVSLKAGGFGLNLTEADYVILLDPWWNPATEAQAVDRVHRIGQTKKVMVYRLVAKDTIEEKVMALKARKAALVSSVLDDGGFETGKLTAEDIRSLLD